MPRTALPILVGMGIFAVLAAACAALTGTSAVVALWVSIWILAVVAVPYLFIRWRPGVRTFLVFARLCGVRIAVFLLAFFVLTTALTFPSGAEGFSDSGSRNWLGLIRLGDLRYLAGAGAGRGDAPQVRVVLLNDAPGMASSRSIADRRRHLASTLKFLTEECRVRGIALDYYFPTRPPIDNPQEELLAGLTDRLFRESIRLAVRKKREGHLAVLAYGMGFSRTERGIGRIDDDERLSGEDGLGSPHTRRGHLGSIGEADGRIRAVGIRFENADVPALSFQVAKALTEGDLELPADGLIRFVRPNRDIRPWTPQEWEDPAKTEEIKRDLSGHIVFVGPANDDDHETPYGRVPGVMIHAYATHSLLSGHFIRTAPWGWSHLVVGVFTALLVFATGPTGRRRGQLKICAVATATAFAISALAMALSLVWIDVAYVTAGFWLAWLFLPVLRPRGAAADGESGLIFVSYSHRDRAWLKALRTHLKPLFRDHPLRIWDDSEIRPGDPWRDVIDKAVRSARLGVLLVSPDFLASDFIEEKELAPLLRAAERAGVRLTWVHVRAASFEATAIERFQAAHDVGTPLAALEAAERDAVLKGIAKEIRRLADEAPDD